jgi:hypothetical protein
MSDTAAKEAGVRRFPYEPLIDLSDPAVVRERVMACNVAASHGWFWLPCPLCGLEFGGQEWMTRNPDHASSVHLPEDEPDVSAGICPFCTLAGRGDEFAAAQASSSVLP